MNLLHPLQHGNTADMSFPNEKETVMKAEHAALQADARFLKAILVGLAFTTCMLGAAAVMAMP